MTNPEGPATAKASGGGAGEREERLQTVQQRLQQQDLTAGVFVPGPNLQYLLDIDMGLTERITMVFVGASGEYAVLTPELELPGMGEAVASFDTHTYADGEPPLPALTALFEACGWRGGAFGVETLRMRHQEVALLRESGAGRLQSFDDEVGRLRAVKSPAEQAAMEQAAALAGEALEDCLNWLRPGMTERQAAARLHASLLESGSEPPAKAPVVAFGPNTALPHTTAGDRRLQVGDPVLIDMGARWQGYVSDITRLVACGELPGELQTVHDAVRRANEAARQAVRPGAALAEIDRAARRVIEEAGYGDQFVHRTGHGLGLELHEYPDVVAGDDAALQVGWSFTIEPGVYLEGLGGVRVEDDVVVTAEGARTLTQVSRDVLALETPAEDRLAN